MALLARRRACLLPRWPRRLAASTSATPDDAGPGDGGGGADDDDEIPRLRSGSVSTTKEARAAQQAVAIANGSLPHFDSFALVRTLRDAGFTEQQAVAVLQALHQTTQEAHRVSSATLASRVDFASLRSELNEIVFNASLKNDLRIRHQKDTTNVNRVHVKDVAASHG